jgi:membrane-associated phospholipid phosphatase
MIHSTANLKQFLKNHRLFIISYLLILVFSIVILLLYKKTDIHLFINGFNCGFFDFVFRYMTEFGAFVLIAPIILFQALIKYRFALITLTSTVFGSLMTQFFKRFVMDFSPRPIDVFKGVYDLHLVENVKIYSSHSFPSGHTTGAFALFFALGLISKRPVYQFLFLMIAVLVGYSRLYLSQHFLIDVVAGSMIGTFSAFVCYFWLTNKKNTAISWMDKSILSQWRLGKH